MSQVNKQTVTHQHPYRGIVMKNNDAIGFFLQFLAIRAPVHPGKKTLRHRFTGQLFIALLLPSSLANIVTATTPT
jgi:hypothetical protein